MKTWILGLCAALCVAPLARAADEPAKAAPSQGNYVVIVGVGETGDKTIQPRATADKDAKDLYDLLSDGKHFDVAADRIVLLTDKVDAKRKSKLATRENILAAVNASVTLTGKDDILVIAYFGRGATAGDRTCLFATDSTFKGREKDSVLGTDLETELKLAKNQKLALIMDVHFKGFDAGKETVIEPNFRDIFAGVFGGEEKGEAPPPHDKIVILSTLPTADPLTKGDNGLFAATLIDGLKGKADIEGYEPDGLVTVDELVKYLEKEIGEQARKIGKTNKEKESVPFIVGETVTHFAFTKNHELTAGVEKRIAAIGKLGLTKEQVAEGKTLLTRMPKLKNLQELRKRYQELADGKLSADDFAKAVSSIKEMAKLSKEDAGEFAAKVLKAIDLVEEMYVKKANPGELTVAAIRGMYRNTDETIPEDLEALLKNAKNLTFSDRKDLLVTARVNLGKREDLEGNKDADMAITMGLASLNDPYTTYYDKETIKKEESRLRGEFRGVGIQIRRDQVKDALLVVSPIKGSPAYKAGITAGDLIVGVKREVGPQGEPLKEGEKKEISTEGMKVEQALDLILGKVGVPVTLIIERDGKRFDVDLKRARISVETVLGVNRIENDDWNYIIDEKDKIAYVQLTQFAPLTAFELADVLRKVSDKGLNGLVLDLRFNPGGVLQGAVTISSLFVEDGKVVTVRPRAGKEERLLTSMARVPQKYTKFPIAVLINGGSASASEIVSACLKDHGRAMIIGERSYGKGSVQQINPFAPTEGQIKLTTAKYFPPNDYNIDKLSKSEDKPDEWGVKPDKGYEIKFSKDETRELAEQLRDREIIKSKDAKIEKPAKEFKDKQLDKALEYLRDQIKAAAK